MNDIEKYKLDALPAQITIGRAGENKYKSIEFDVTIWKELYLDSTVSIIFQRPDGKLYPVVVDNNANSITWTPNYEDLFIHGTGKIEFRLLAGDILGKSEIVETLTLKSLSPPRDRPSKIKPDWVDNLLITVDEVKTVHIETIEQVEIANDSSSVSKTASIISENARDESTRQAEIATLKVEEAIDVMEATQAIYNSIYHLQKSPPVELLNTAIVLITPTIDML